MKYSVLIPAYNCAEVIADTIESIRYAGLPDYEIIVVDDGSTDQTREVLEKLQKQDDSLVVLSQPNSGVSAARNRGLAQAQGEYLLFVDADDILVRDAYQHAAEIVERFKPDVLMFGMRFEYEHKGVCYQTLSLTCRTEGLLKDEEWVLQLVPLFRCNYLSSVCNKMIRRERIVDLGLGFREGMFLMEDCRFSLECLQYCETVYLLPEAIYRYKLQDDGKKAAQRVRRIESLGTYMEHFSGLSSAFSPVVREIYFMLLSQRINDAATVAELEKEAANFRGTEYWEEIPAGHEAAKMLKEGQYRKLLLRNMKRRLRHKAAVTYRSMKLLRCGAAEKRT